MLSNKDKISYLIQIANGIIPLLIIPLLARDKGLNLLGDYFLALSIIGSTQVVVDYGFNLSGVRSFSELIESRASSSDIWSLLISIVFAKLLIAVLLATVFILYVIICGAENYIYVSTCVFVGVVLSVTNAAPLVFALKQSLRLSIVTFVSRVIFILPLVVIQPSLFVALVVTLFPVLITNVYSFILASRCIEARLHQIKIKLKILEQFAVGRSIFFNSIIASLISTTWPLILSNSLSRTELGVYGIADKIVKGLMTLVAPLPPFILASSHQGTLISSLSLVLKNKLYRTLLLLVIFAPISILILPDIAIQSLFGNGLNEHRIVLNVYGLGFFFFFCNLTLYTFLIVAKNEALYAPVVATSFLFSIGISFISELYIYTPLLYELIVALTLMLIVLRKNYCN